MTISTIPPVLPDEAQRLAALHALAVLDTGPDTALDVITRLAADRFDTAIAIVSLVDSNRQWFKARHGLDACETARADSFCAHCIASDAVMVVPDAQHDPRFVANPLVTGAPHIRFYAAAPLKTASGHRIGTLAVIDPVARSGFSPRDMAALRLMAGQVMDWLESARARQQQRISHLIEDTTSDAFVCSDADNVIIHWNRGAEAMFGWSAAEAMGRPMDLIIPDRHRHGHNLGMARLRTGGRTRLVGKTVEVPAVRRAGGEFPIELSLGMWPAEGEGHPQGFAAIIRDVSARKQLEDQRAATEAVLGQQLAAIEASDDGIAVTDAEGRFIFMNRSHASMFGYPDASYLIGQPWSVLYSEAMARHIGEVAMPVLGTAGRWRGEVQGRRADGSTVEQEVSLSLSNEGGIVCVTRDIGQRLLLEREKARLREQLMLAQRHEAVGQLASGIAHDFNNLIAAIAGTAGLLEAMPDPGVRHHALRIQQAAGTATALVDKLLALGSRTPDLKQIDVRRVLTGVRDLVTPSLVGTSQRIELDLPDAPVLALADETELLQVVLNLVLNARDALPAAGEGRIGLAVLPADGHPPVGPVLVGAMPRAAAALIRVSDNGCGIPSNEVEQVFQPFFTRKGGAGTGLGLAVVAGIVANAGAAIALFSRPGTGTLFEIFWPLQSAALDGAWPGLELAADAAVLAGKAVLVVDDNPAVVDTVVAMLEQAGAEPGPCLDPEDAVLAVQEDTGAWDLVITDYDMPGLNGAGLARRLRSVRADLPVLLMTALPQLHQRRSGEAELFDAVLAKPATMSSLMDAARTAMANAIHRNA